MFCDVNVLWIEQIGIHGFLNHIDDSRLQVNEQTSWDIVFIVRLGQMAYLIEKDVLSVLNLDIPGLENSLGVDAVFLAQLFPELHAH